MKKAIYLVISCVMTAVLVPSCDLDRESPDSIPFDEAFKSMDAIRSLELGAYSRLRTAYSLSSIIAPDIQADYVNAVYGFSNTYGGIYQWTYDYSDSDITTAWNNLYGAISQYNFILDGISGSLGFNPSEDEKLELERIQGRMYLMRAM